MIGFIINPVSGNGRGKKVWIRLESLLKTADRRYHAFFTKGPGDAAHLAKKMFGTGQYQAIVAVGGDGTVNETVSGLWEALSIKSEASQPKKPCSFGCIPAGSGNDFARGHGIPAQTDQAFAVLLNALDLEHPPKAMDLLRIGQRIAVNSISCGFDGQIALTTNNAIYKKGFNLLGLGKLAYVLSVIRVLLTYQPRSLVLRVDDQELALENVWLVAAGNIPYYGGGMKICPSAVPDDGLVSLCVVHGINRFELLRFFPLVFSGSHERHRAVHMLSGKIVEIKPSSPLAIQADGEPVITDHILIEVLPAVLPVLKPTSAANAGKRAIDAMDETNRASGE
ncbi:MAG: diacylglycerol kinase family lipid kinase [Gorillibacterium sp.]|nr:diacylglycerol kinase family lipid kinase [Gorillibacterium sp.]